MEDDMSDPQDQTEAKISELISSKIAAGQEDSGLFVALTILHSLPVLKDIAQSLKNIDGAIAPDLAGYSVSEELRSIRHMLDYRLKKEQAR
jgi:hypothetical protein